MGRFRPNPPPTRTGVSPSCVVLPAAGPWVTLTAYFAHRFPGVSTAEWQRRMEAGEVVDDEGSAIGPHSPFVPEQRLYYYRTVHTEPRIPFEETLLWQDEHLLVVDKPHFLPVMPSGKYVQETVLVRLKNRLGLHDLVPIHRIDRDTAGLVMFSINPATRDAYHALFRDHTIQKTYECIAPWNPTLTWPMRRESRIVEGTHFLQQMEVEGPPNALTTIAPLEVLGTWARYTLQPVTGQRHQLRVHMAALGLPMAGDGIYPVLTAEDATDYQRPLQLLAREVAFTDPLSGKPMRFTSQRSLRPLADFAEMADTPDLYIQRP